MKITSIRHSRKGFTLLELIVGMMIFSLAITSIFLLLQTTMRSASISRNEIVVANLLREQIELVRNTRDTNFLKASSWDIFRIENSTETKFSTGSVYAVENDFSHTGVTFSSSTDLKIEKSPVKIQKLDFSESSDVKEKFEKSQLCFDAEKRFVHCGGSWTGETVFASYFLPKAMEYKTSAGDTKTLENGWIIDARVIVRDGANYREYDAKTAITNWQN